MTCDLITREDYERLERQLSDLNTKLDMIMAGINSPDIVHVSDVARIEGLTVTGLKKQPWLMPNFGNSEYEGRCRWKYETFQNWRAKPVRERKLAWETYTSNRLANRA